MFPETDIGWQAKPGPTCQGHGGAVAALETGISASFMLFAYPQMAGSDQRPVSPDSGVQAQSAASRLLSLRFLLQGFLGPDGIWLCDGLCRLSSATTPG